MRNANDLTPQRKADLLAVQRLADDSLRYYNLGQNKQGESRLRQALAARKQALRGRLTLFDGPETEDVNRYKRAGLGPEALQNLLVSARGLLARDLEQFADAELLLQEALNGKMRIFGAEHGEVIPVLQSLASVYTDQGLYDESEPLLLSSLALARREYGHQSDQTAWSLYHLANLYHLQSRTAEAEPLMREAVRLRKEQGGQERPASETAIMLSDYAALLHADGKPKRAALLESQIEEIWKMMG